MSINSINNTFNNINNGLNNAVNTMGDFTQGAVQLGQALNGLNNALNGMPTDQYVAGSTVANPSGKVELKKLFAENGQYWPNPLENRFADRLAWFGINDSQEFLKAANTPFKRSMMSFLVGFGNDRKYIRQKIDQWAGQADLVRTGASVNDAKLMQISGVKDSLHLSMYSNPIDKGALYAAMGANAMQYGFYMPSLGALSSSIDKAKTLPPIIRWN
jgi:hypothetical protein